MVYAVWGGENVSNMTLWQNSPFTQPRNITDFIHYIPTVHYSQIVTQRGEKDFEFDAVFGVNSTQDQVCSS